jgi:hypothetical protein
MVHITARKEKPGCLSVFDFCGEFMETPESRHIKYEVRGKKYTMLVEQNILNP